jgi:hypothetical protein
LRPGEAELHNGRARSARELSGRLKSFLNRSGCNDAWNSWTKQILSVGFLCDNHGAADPLLTVTTRSLSHTLKESMKIPKNTRPDVERPAMPL